MSKYTVKSSLQRRYNLLKDLFPITYVFDEIDRGWTFEQRINLQSNYKHYDTYNVTKANFY